MKPIHYWFICLDDWWQNCFSFFPFFFFFTSVAPRFSISAIRLPTHWACSERQAFHWEKQCRADVGFGHSLPRKSISRSFNGLKNDGAFSISSAVSLIQNCFFVFFFCCCFVVGRLVGELWESVFRMYELFPKRQHCRRSKDAKKKSWLKKTPPLALPRPPIGNSVCRHAIVIVSCMRLMTKFKILLLMLSMCGLLVSYYMLKRVNESEQWVIFVKNFNF